MITSCLRSGFLQTFHYMFTFIDSNTEYFIFNTKKKTLSKLRPHLLSLFSVDSSVIQMRDFSGTVVFLTSRCHQDAEPGWTH